MEKDPRDLTIGDCRAAGHTVFLACGRCRVGRDLALSKAGKWADHKLLDLAREGRFKCSKCGTPSNHVSVWGHLVAQAILRWNASDDQPR